ncbi:MAG TPA: YceI family protein [Alphaproteobacteria bacterium]|nr:YceI family protein [Alphaproteobacteria bacterium]
MQGPRFGTISCVATMCCAVCCPSGPTHETAAIRPQRQIRMRRRNQYLANALSGFTPLAALIVWVCLLAIPDHAQAEEWRWHMLPESTLTFTFTQSGSALEGRFAHFSTEINLNPAAPETGAISAVIDVTSINTENSNRDTLLQSAELFDTGRWPQAVFTTNKITREADGSYLADATLTIRDVSRPVVLPFTLDIQGQRAIAKGALTILRSDFGIGQGQWAGTDIVADPVTIHLLIHASKQS